jgi:hypothetical protein
LVEGDFMSGGAARTTVMARFRRARLRIAAAAVVCQALFLALSLVVVYGGTAEAHEEKCPHGHGAMCPMHHRSADPTATGFTNCGRKTDVAVVTWLFGVADVVPAPTSAVITSPPQIFATGDSTPSSLRPAPPDPPPHA